MKQKKGIELMELEQNQEMEIDLGDLLKMLLSNWILLLISGVMVATFVYGFFTFFYEKEYSSSAQIYMLIDEQSNDLNYSSQLSVSQSLASDCVVFVESPAVLEQVKRNLNLEYSYEELDKMVSASVASTSTRIVTISVVSSDPYEAMTIANEVQKVTLETIYTNMRVSVSIFNEASLATQSNAKSLPKMLLIGFVIGVFMAIVVLSLLHILNDKICTEMDVERYLKLSVLGAIPLYHTNIYMTEEEINEKYGNSFEEETKQSPTRLDIDMEKIEIAINQTVRGREK